MKVLALVSLTSIALLSSPAVFGVTVAVIDSGVDYRHRDLSPRMWVNDGDAADDSVDNDANGFIDDVYGWNFAEKNNQVIDYQYLNQFSEDCFEYFRVQGRILDGTATPADKEWYETKRADKTFIQELSTFGNFVHGTHVSGIASASRSIEQVLAVKIIPTKTPGISGLLAPLDLDRVREAAAMADNPLTKILLHWMINTLVDQQVGVIVSAGEYVAAHGADVANGSFGISYAAAKTAISGLLESVLGRKPTEAEVKEYTNYMVDRVNEKCREFVTKAPNTVFVFAAGNDGTDNDSQSMAPANVGGDNVISVAATLGVRSLATFSNFGVRTVDVAAPGVVVESTVPGDKYLTMSGTSMAAPFVAEVAALVKDANPALSAGDVKKIVVETVDRKDYLTGKVRSGGVVNSARAVTAARSSREMSVAQAIAAAASVPDVAETLGMVEGAETLDIVPIPLPSLL